MDSPAPEMNSPASAAPDNSKRNMMIIAGSVVGALACCVLIPICTIVVLALMGPAIQNIFEEILRNLG